MTLFPSTLRKFEECDNITMKKKVTGGVDIWLVGEGLGIALAEVS